jgi:hypothetical protein
MSVATSARPRATFGVKRTNIPGVLDRAQAMHAGMSTNVALFPAPTVSMVVLFDLISSLATTQQARTATRAAGLASLRNTKRDLVWSAMLSLCAYVQSLADQVSAESAASLIEAAGMVIAATTSHKKLVLQAVLTTTPGVVHLIANISLLVGPASGSKKTMVNWQWSGDGGATWIDVHSTPYANTYITGLALMSTYLFRVSVTIGTKAGEWSQPVSLLIH